MKWSMWSSRVAALIWALSLAGCAASSASAPNADLDADALYPWGAQRDDLETRYGRGAFYWIVNETPRDEFAAATIKAMVSIRKPRPASYEVFARRNLGPGDAYCRDYVFFSDRNFVLYTARRTINP
jgi:hypothetical protein